tara:strand:+ start:747 stop:992 length:246 start_codon:yes stop_codon:yes gene_type:complete
MKLFKDRNISKFSKIIFFFVLIFICIKIILSNSLIIIKVLLNDDEINKVIYDKLFVPNSLEIIQRLKSDDFEIIIEQKKDK